MLAVEFDGPPADRDAPITREELGASVRRVAATGIVPLTRACPRE